MIALAFLLASSNGACLELKIQRPAGAPVRASDVVAVPCPAKPLAGALRYDPRMGANVALFPLRVRDVIPAASLATLPGVRRGERLALSSRVGPVRIERPVTALQTARPGDEQIFVKTGDGEVFAVAIERQGASPQ